MVHLLPKTSERIRPVPVHVKYLVLGSEPTDEFLEQVRLDVRFDGEWAEWALKVSEKELDGVEEEGGWDLGGGYGEHHFEEEEEDEDGEGGEGGGEEEGEEEEKEEEEPPAKETSLSLAALKAVGTFPEAEDVADHECVACFCHPKEEGWGDRTWLKLPCSRAHGPSSSPNLGDSKDSGEGDSKDPGDSSFAHVVCSSCCVSLAKNGLVTCPHCRASYLPPIFQALHPTP